MIIFYKWFPPNLSIKHTGKYNKNSGVPGRCTLGSNNTHTIFQVHLIVKSLLCVLAVPLPWHEYTTSFGLRGIRAPGEAPAVLIFRVLEKWIAGGFPFYGVTISIPKICARYPGGPVFEIHCIIWYNHPFTIFCRQLISPFIFFVTG